jgi:hypothetical protein
MASLAVFAVFSSKLSTIDTFLSAEILSRRRFSRRKNSQMLTVLPLFSAVFRSEASRPRSHRVQPFPLVGSTSSQWYHTGIVLSI